MINTLSALTCELVDENSNSPVSDVRAENFYFQVKFIDCYLREIISFTNKIDIRDLGQSRVQRVNADTNGWCYCRTVSKSFWGLKCVNIFDAKLSWYKKWEISQLLHSFFQNHARTLHPFLTFLLDDHSSIQLLVAFLLPQRLDVRPYSKYINTKSASSLPLHVMMFLIKGA